MKSKSLILLLFSLSVMAFGEPEVVQVRHKAVGPADRTTWAQFHVAFKTPEEAKAAKFEILPLPDGKEVAFSTRWDDGGGGDFKVAPILDKYGLPATFFHMGADTGHIARITGPKRDIGCHTLHHAALGGCDGNTSFYELCANRVSLEVASQSPVHAMVFPGCVTWDNFWTDSGRKILGRACKGTGLTSSPVFLWKDMNRVMDLKTNEYFCSFVFSPDDKKCKPELFHKTMTNALDLIRHGKILEPIITMGVHPWHDAEGLANLEKVCASVARGDYGDFWYCTQKEYAAYRMLYMHAKEESRGRFSQDGKSYLVTYSMPTLQFAGVDVPLSIRIPDNAVEFNWKPVTNRIVRLWHRERRLPVKFSKDKMEELGGGLSIDYARNCAELALTNLTDHVVLIDGVLHLPGHWIDGTIVAANGELAAGQVKLFEIALGPKSRLAELQGGVIYTAAEIDFRGKEKDAVWKRLWVDHKDEFPRPYSRANGLPINYSTTTGTPTHVVDVPAAGEYWLWCWLDNNGFKKVTVNGDQVFQKMSFGNTHEAVKLNAGENEIVFEMPDERKGKRTGYSFAITRPDCDPRTEYLSEGWGCEKSFIEDFETTQCGQLPKSLSSAANGVTTNELSRWVQNTDAFEGTNALAYDFSQLEAGSRGTPSISHGWLSWYGNDKITNGWIVWKAAFKRDVGNLSGEIRGIYKDNPQTNPHSWIAYWLTMNDKFIVRPHTGKDISIGKIPFRQWCQAEIWMPTPCNYSSNAYGRINLKVGDRFEKGEWKTLPNGPMIMIWGYNLMQIGGSGKSKWLIDDIRVSREL